MILYLEPAIAIPLFFVLGLVMGSFGNVLIGRLPQGESITGRSHCPHCGKTITAFELIPVLSWMFLRGKCSKCKKSISIQYPLIELLSGGLFVWAFNLAPLFPLAAFALALAFWAMLLIAVIDYKTQLIPDVLTLLLALSAGVYQLLSMGHLSWMAVLVGMGFFGTQWILSKGRWVGSGDIFLAGALGLLLGSWQYLVMALMLSYIIGAAVAIVLLLTKRVGKKAQLSFGPFLVLGTFIVYWLGGEIMVLLFGGFTL